VALALATTALLVVALSIHSAAAFGLVALALIFVPMERIFALHPQKVFRKNWASDIVHFLVNNILIIVVLLAAFAPLLIALHLLIPASFRAAVAHQPKLLQFAEALVIVEVCSYWSHRASHRYPLLWRFHAVHHSIEEMDWLASARQHPVDAAFREASFVIPLYALGFSKVVFGGAVVFFAVLAIFIHANVRWTFGPLRYMIATPNFHHWHHGNQPESYNANFAGEFPLIDAVFGTLHLPKKTWPDRYGIDAPLPAGYLRQMAMPFKGPATVPVPDVRAK
jgi:sterol desaturase/sphingolipid hydroxylase (fatty acid hydroxylase superfamily)